MARWPRRPTRRCAPSLQEERDRLHRPAPPDGPSVRAASSTSTTASPTRARSPRSGARSTRWRGSLLETLQEIEDALRKFDAGTYGTCESCGKQIAEARLEAMPSARLCIDLRVQPPLTLDRRDLSAELEERLIFFACLFVAIILHEISHGVVALWFGDDTAKHAGRLTLNPIPHIDPFGSIILPAMLTITGFGAFGWAKPVPVDPTKLRNPRREMLWVGLVGPFANFALMAVGGGGGARRLRRTTPASRSGSRTCRSCIQVLLFFALANLFLGLFNLLPIPPLDGSSLIERVLPATGCRPGTGSVRTGSRAPARRLVDQPVRHAVLAVHRRAVRLHRRDDRVAASHLPRRFVRALWPGPPRAATSHGWRASSSPSELALWRSAPEPRPPVHDPGRDGVEAATWPARSTPGEPRWLAAALLHDIGKLDAGLGVVGRSAATVMGCARRTGTRRRWAQTRRLPPAGVAVPPTTTSAARTGSGPPAGATRRRAGPPPTTTPIGAPSRHAARVAEALRAADDA